MSDVRTVPARVLQVLDEESSAGTGLRGLEGHLRKLCEALLEMLPEQIDQPSLLSNVLPSFVPLVCSSLPFAEAMRTELRDWEHRSEQLVSLAKLHCGASAKDLATRLEHTAQLSSKAIATLDVLKSAATKQAPLLLHDSVFEDHSSLPTTDADVGIHRTTEQHLRDLCEAILGLLQMNPEHGSILSQATPSMVTIFADCDTGSLRQLKSERKAREESALQLLAIAATHSGRSASELRQRVAQSLASAARVIRALEAMQLSVLTESNDRFESDVDISTQTNGTPRLDTHVSHRDRAHAEDLYAEAGRLQQQREFEAAEKVYTEALQFDPSLRLAYLHRGRVRLHLRQPALAIVDLDEAVRLSSDDSLGFSSRGDALALCGRFSEAIADYSRALELRPDNRVVRYNHAVALRQVGNLSEAWNEFELLVAVEPDNASLYLNRGMICVARGDRDDAIREFRQAVSLQPDSKEATERLWELERARESESKGDLRLSDFGNQSNAEALTDNVDLPLIPIRGPKRISDADIAQILSDSSIPTVSSSPTRPARTRSLKTAETSAELAVPREQVEPDCESRLVAPKPHSNPVAEEKNSASVPHGATANVVIPENPVAEPASDYQITIHCPACRAPSTVRWDRLQAGKVLSCRHCGGGFTTDEDGTLTSVERGADGKWRKAIPHATPWHKSRAVQAAVASGILAFTLAFVLMRPTRVVEQQLPEDLEPRAALFAEAWLKKDYRIIRRLTHPAEGPQLFAWHKKHPAPELKQKVKIAVEVISDEPPLATLVVRLDGLKSPDGSTRELSLDWKEQNGQWLFLPTSETRLSSRTRAELALPVSALATLFDGDSRLPKCGSKSAPSVVPPAQRIEFDSVGVHLPPRSIGS